MDENRYTVIRLTARAVGLVLVVALARDVVAVELTSDCGDAPDASNSLGVSMSAYPGVAARFPTSLQSAPPFGPRHENNPAFFILGQSHSGEGGAESGADDDPDGQNNIQPASDLADRDGLDDGLIMPETFGHCQPVTLTYSVTVLNTYTRPVFANLWADWNHDGAWGDGPPAACPGAGATAPEWVLKNQPLNLSNPGIYVFTVVFTPWYPDPHAGTWLRLSVAEQMAEADGSGPAAGYQLGETEDYLVSGTPRMVFLPAIQGGHTSPPPPPPDPRTHSDPDVPAAVIASWPQLPDGIARAIIPEDGLILRLQNNGDFSGNVTIDVTLMQNGTRSRETTGPVSIQAGPWTTNVVVRLPQGMSVRSPGTILAEVHVIPDGPSGGDPGRNQPFDTSPGLFYFHEHAGQAGRLIIYGEDGYRAQIEARAFDSNPGLWGRMSAGFSNPIPEGLAQIIAYEHGDPVLMEGEPDEGHGHPPTGDGITEADVLHGTGGAFTLCLEWFTAPVDNGFGEDFGLQDTGWRARGALVRVIYAGSLAYDGYLNTAGCASIPMDSDSGGTALIIFDGVARLASGGGFNYLHRVSGWYPPAAPNHWDAQININGVQSGQTYRPEISFNDAFSIISWAMQVRFNGGVSNEHIYLVQAECAMDPAADDSCSTTYGGLDTIFVQPSQWQRKYVVAHEYGHKILSLATNYTNDCDYGESHGMDTSEYASCAAMEGWAHFVAADIFNAHDSVNPGGVFVYWNGVDYDIEKQLHQCYANANPDSWCDEYGVEKDWMRFWWDFHTNAVPGDPPTHIQLFSMIDDVAWENGPWAASDAFRDVLSGSLAFQWDYWACHNGIAYDHCQ